MNRRNGRAIAAYRRAAEHAARAATDTGKAAGPPSPAGVLAMLALLAPCAVLAVTSEPALLVAMLCGQGVAFLAGLVLGVEGAGEDRGQNQNQTGD